MTDSVLKCVDEEAQCLVSEPLSTPPLTSNNVKDVGGNSERKDWPDALRVYLRIRPLSPEEVAGGEDKRCVRIDDERTVEITAPLGMARVTGHSVQRFTFAQVFPPSASQQELYDATMCDMVRDFMTGTNILIFAYGVTNSGKTYTIQGPARDPGLLPRALSTLFSALAGRHSASCDLRPCGAGEVRQTEAHEAQQDVTVTNELFGSEIDPSLSTGCNSTPTLLTESRDIAEAALPANCSFAVWISFCEIYNETVYELLEAPARRVGARRVGLHFAENRQGKAFLKDVRWVKVNSAAQAQQLVMLGQKNLSMGSTRLNQNSSRGHSIFSVRLLRISENEHGQDVTVSELNLCDLAGSECPSRSDTTGDRLKEGGNINASLMTLGKCIHALRSNQFGCLQRFRKVVPFRESKLTRLFQGFFCGHGQASMVVNINPCASYYESLHALKFSSVAKQVVSVQVCPSPTVGLRLTTREMALVTGYPTLQHLIEKEEESENDSMVETEDLLEVIEALKRQLIDERKEKIMADWRARQEVVQDMTKQFLDLEKFWSDKLEEERQATEERWEQRMELYTDAMRQYAERKAARTGPDDHIVTLAQLHTEKSRTLALEQQLKEQQDLLKEQDSQLVSMTEALGQTEASLQASQHELEQKATELERYRTVYWSERRLSRDFLGASPGHLEIQQKLEEALKEGEVRRREMHEANQSRQKANVRAEFESLHDVGAPHMPVNAETKRCPRSMKKALTGLRHCLAGGQTRSGSAKGQGTSPTTPSFLPKNKKTML
uniref:kinesin-like protein KIF20A n=1 Tax=Myxine glutinosa TaxID=7769 RepID=UPI00358F0238